MKALLFTHAYPPMRYPRSIQISRLVKYLSCEVDVVCCNEIGFVPDASLPASFGRNPGQIIRHDHRPVGGRLLRKLVNFFSIPDAHIGWSLATARAVAAKGSADGYNALVTFGQPMSNHLAGVYLKSRLSVPWMAHFSDPWADNPYHGTNPIRRVANQFLERMVVRAADMLVFTSDKTSALVMAKYPSELHRKVRVLPHAFDPELYPAQVRRAGPLVIRHLGNFYPPRSPALLLEALLILQRREPNLLEDVRVEFVGEVSSRIALDKLLRELTPGLVAFLPSVNYLESLRLMTEASLLLVIDAPFQTSVFLPSKLVDYLGAGVPIFAVSPSGTTADLVGEYGGTVASPFDAEDVAEKLAYQIRAIRQNHHSSSLNKGCRERYEAASVATEFEIILTEMLSNRSPERPGNLNP